MTWRRSKRIRCDRTRPASPSPTPTPTATATPSPDATLTAQPSLEAQEQTFEQPSPTPTSAPSPTPTPVILPTVQPPISQDDPPPLSLLQPIILFALVVMLFLLILVIIALLLFWWWEWRGFGGLSPVSRAYARLERYIGLLGINVGRTKTTLEKRRELQGASRPPKSPFARSAICIRGNAMASPARIGARTRHLPKPPRKPGIAREATSCAVGCAAGCPSCAGNGKLALLKDDKMG